MRAVLVLAYYFPPCGTVGGLRTLKFCRYLPDAGWRPIVVAGEHPGTGNFGHHADDLEAIESVGKVVRVPAGRVETASAWARRMPEALRRMIRLGLSPRWGTDTRFGWMRAAHPCARDLIEREKPSAIFVSFTPVGSLRLSCRLKEETGLPQVFDFRDAWTTNPGRPYVAPWQTAYERRWEKHLLKQADQVVTVTEDIAHDLRAAGAARVSTVPNGYDERDFSEVAPDLPLDAWRLTFVGSLYPQVDLGNVARAMRLLAEAHPEAKPRLRMVGGISPAHRAQVASAGFLEGLEVVAPVPLRDAVREMRSAHALFFPLWTGPGTSAFQGGKTLEYLRSGRPVLGLMPHCNARNLLARLGHPVLPNSATEHDIFRILEPWLLAPPPSKDLPEDLRRFERRNLALELGAVLDRAASRGNR